jgi:ABC-type Fe3+/spermidine/putrescine transport system ATPase subunit
MSNETNIILRTTDLNFSYGDKKILKSLSFSLEKGEIAVFLGRSGVGKTTFLKLIAGLEHPDKGSIKKFGISMSDSDFFIPPNKRNIGVVFQEDSLFPHLNIFENIKLANKSISQNDVLEMFSIFQLNVDLTKYPHQLSGGQKQRVATIRALVQEPDCILFDEPFSALDYHLRVKLRRHLRKLLKEKGISAIFITHDREEALLLADKIYVLNDQKIIQRGTPQEVMESPNNTYVANFLGCGLVVTGKQIQQLYKGKDFSEKNFFIPCKDLIFGSQETIFGLSGIICEKNINPNNSHHYYFKLDGMNKEYGPFTSITNLDIGEKIKVEFPEDVTNLINIDVD